MNFEDDILKGDQSKPEETLPPALVKEEIEKMENISESERNRLRLIRLMKETEEPGDEEKLLKALDEMADAPEDYLEMPEISPDVYEEAGIKDPDDDDTEGNFTDEMVLKLIAYYEEKKKRIEEKKAIIKMAQEAMKETEPLTLEEEGEYQELTEALEELEKNPENEKLDPESLAVKAEGLIEENKKNLENVREEIRNLTEPKL